MTHKNRIFLAHASEDKVRVRELYGELKDRGFEPWLDDVDLLPGQIWADEISKVIKSAGIFLACLSRNSVDKVGYVQSELRQALVAFGHRPPGSIFLIPVRFEDCEIPDMHLAEYGLGLRQIHAVDLFSEDGIERLSLAIKHTLANDDVFAADVAETEAPPSSRARATTPPITGAKAKPGNPTIKAAWIGAVAVVMAAILTSPWLVEFLNPGDQKGGRIMPSTVDVTVEDVEPAAAPVTSPLSPVPSQRPSKSELLRADALSCRAEAYRLHEEANRGDATKSFRCAEAKFSQAADLGDGPSSLLLARLYGDEIPQQLLADHSPDDYLLQAGEHWCRARHAGVELAKNDPPFDNPIDCR